MNPTLKQPATATEQFRGDVINGLEHASKRINSKYFYDAEGDHIFQRIMAAPEYYLTRAENEILSTQTNAVLEALMGSATALDLYELGAGDGTKTKHLLRHGEASGRMVTYRPIDISAHVLEELGAALAVEFPGLHFEPVVAEYFQALRELPMANARPKAILFLGSNIGNLNKENAVSLMKTVAKRLGPADRLLIGFDLKKDPATILAAYNDAGGHTRDFNLNLLVRMNRELGANFNVDRYIHAPVYDPATGRALSYIVSTCDQEVRIPGAAYPIQIRKWETIHTEISQKYDMPMIEDLAELAGLRITKRFTDQGKNFTDVVFAAY